MNSKPSKRLSFQERENKILKAAVMLFSQKGFDGTTTKMVALKAGINEALLYRHFPTKQKLYSAILRKKLLDFQFQFIPALHLTLNMPLQKGLLSIAQLIVLKFRKDPVFLRMMLYSALENHQISHLFFKQRLPLVEFLEEYFQQKIKQGKVKPLDPEILAKAFFSMLHHYGLVTNIFKVKDYFHKSEREVLKNYVLIFLEGVKR